MASGHARDCLQPVAKFILMSALHCFFCGGKECKYENWRLWNDPEKYAGVNAIDGLFSSWITSNILAMQRPSTRIINEYEIIKVFNESSIGAIFNLQCPGEHLSCGDGVEPLSGFSYLPEKFIESNIMHYNFGWTDMDTPDLDLMLTIVSVMAHVLEKKKKVAVHCHAGLGRTGLTIACYLVFAENLPSETAILIVRGKRPLSVQTKKQAVFVSNFENHLKKLKIIFPGAFEKAQRVLLNIQPLSFRDVIINQRKWLKNHDVLTLKYIPKIIYTIMERLLELCSETEQNWYTAIDTFVEFEGIQSPHTQKVYQFQEQVNMGEWACIRNEANVVFLVQMLMYWLSTLKCPLISDESLSTMGIPSMGWEDKFTKMGKEEFETLNYMLGFFRKAPSISKSTLGRVFDILVNVLTSERKTLKYFMDPISKPAPLQSTTAELYIKSLRAVVQPTAEGISQTAQTTLSSLTFTSMDMLQTIKNMTVSNPSPPKAAPNMKSIEGLDKLPSPKKKQVGLLVSPPSPVAQSSTTNDINTVGDEGGLVPNELDRRASIGDQDQPRSSMTASIEGLINLLNHIYKSYSISNSNSAISSLTKERVFTDQKWSTPTEIIDTLPEQGSRDNLAMVFKNNPQAQFTAVNSLKLLHETASFSASHLPALFSGEKESSAAVKAEEPLPPPALVKRRSSSVGAMTSPGSFTLSPTDKVLEGPEEELPIPEQQAVKA